MKNNAQNTEKRPIHAREDEGGPVGSSVDDSEREREAREVE